MKYYCKNCDSEIRTKQFIPENECTVCGSDKLSIIPDYETPAQYMKRTGKPISDYTACYEYSFMPFPIDRRWRLNNKCHCAKDNIIVIADPPIPPPDSWKPEEV